MPRGYFENGSFSLRYQVLIISFAPYKAGAASLRESYSEFQSWNRARHSLVKVFYGLYEASVSQYCAGGVILFNRYAFKF